MNYQRIYDQIIEQAKSQNRKRFKIDDPDYVYYEEHHIIPRCEPFCGNNKKGNKVFLTAREHFICHRLLTFIYDGHSGLFKAYYFMAHAKSDNQERDFNVSAREFERLRIQFSLNQTGDKNHNYNKKGELHYNYNSHINKGVPKSLESIQLRKETLDKKPFLTCEWCNLITNNHSFFKRYHGDCCKLNPNRIVIIKPKITCPWCLKEGNDNSGFKSMHFNNCPKNPDYRLEDHQLTCPWCGKVGLGIGMKSKHFDNCVKNPNYVPKEKQVYTCKYCPIVCTNRLTMAKLHNDNCKHNPEYIPKEIELLTCPTCSLQGYAPGMYIHHFNNCPDKINRNKIKNILDKLKESLKIA